MAFLIGIDEAGYAPNLGPLVIGGCLWRIPSTNCELYLALRNTVSAKPEFGKLTIADSKLVHTADRLESLELAIRVLHPAFRTGEGRTIADLLQECPDFEFDEWPATPGLSNLLWSSDRIGSLLESLHSEPSIMEATLRVPLTLNSIEDGELQAQFQRTCAASGIELCRLVCLPIFPKAYNSLVERLGNKSNLLSTASLLLAKHLLGDVNQDDAAIYCDKHGGRNRYGFLVERCLSERPVTKELESPAVSRYRWTCARGERRVQFAASGEAELPVALASMYAKYVRELCMVGFNQYWERRIPGVAPTKGYPVDARRFRRDVESFIPSGVADEAAFWRLR